VVTVVGAVGTAGPAPRGRSVQNSRRKVDCGQKFIPAAARAARQVVGNGELQPVPVFQRLALSPGVG